LTVARVLRGSFSDGGVVRSAKGEDRIAGLSRLTGLSGSKQGKAEEGDCIAFGRLDHVATGDTFGDAKAGAPAPAVALATPPQPAHALALAVKDRKDEVRLAAAMTKLIEEDPSLSFIHDQEAAELKLCGQGEMHLRVALERLSARFGVTVEAHKPVVGYRETIRHAASVRGRHKKQSGGHGQFGDVAATASSLMRPCMAAPCREISFPPSRKAAATRWSAVPWAFRWSTSRPR
jgi:elongation factor G